GGRRRRLRRGPDGPARSPRGRLRPAGRSSARAGVLAVGPSHLCRPSHGAGPGGDRSLRPRGDRRHRSPVARGNHPTGPAGTLVVGQAGRRRLRIRRRPSGETARRDARECVAHRPAGRRPGRRSLGAPGGRRGGVPPRLARGDGTREGGRRGPVDAHGVAAPWSVSRRVRRCGRSGRSGRGVRYGGARGTGVRAGVDIAERGLGAGDGATAHPRRTRAARDVARAAALTDLRIALVDLVLEHPTLHETVGLTPTEGIVDAFEYDVSLTKAAHEVDRVFFIPAGTVTAHAGDLFANPRWKK